MKNVTTGSRLLVVLALAMSVCITPQQNALAGDLLAFYEYVSTRDQDLGSNAMLMSQAMDARVDSRRSELYPQLSLLATEVRRKQEVSNIGSTFIRTGEISFDNSRHVALLRQPIFDPELSGKLAVAKIQQASANVVTDLEQLDELKLYFEEYVAASLYKSLDQSYRRTILQLNEILSSAERKFELKLIKLHELSTLKLHALDLDKNARNNQALFADLLEKLTQVGAPDSPPLVGVLSQDISSLVSKTWFEIDNEFSPDSEVASLHADISLLDQEIENEHAKRWPTLSAVALYEFDDGAESIFGDSTRVSNYEVGIQLEWALFEGGRRKHAIREASFLKNSKLAALKQRQELRRTEYTQLQTRLNRGQQFLQDEQEILKYRRVVRDAIERGYEAGTETLISTVDAILRYEESVRQFDLARYESLLNFIELTSFTGGIGYEEARAIDSLFQ